METQMTAPLQVAKDALFGDEGLRASNFKMFPGNARDATPAQIAEELAASIKRISEGDFEVIEDGCV
jgi:hypothetical protein